MAKSAVLDVEGKAHTLRIGETYLIGLKSTDCFHDIEIEDQSVDVRHCILDFTEKTPKLIDVKSKAGTFLNGTRVASCTVIPICKSSTMQIGNVEATLQLLNASDSGYLETRLSPLMKDRRLSRTNQAKMSFGSCSQVSLTSTPKLASFSCLSLQPNNNREKLLRRSAENESSRRSDSFFIPETQYPVANHSSHRNESAGSVSASTNSKSRSRFSHTGCEDDDFFIPETQEVASTTASTKLSRYPRVAFDNGNVNESVPDDDKIPSSQFQMSTQEFNGEHDGNSNQSDDILANVPSSLIIPAIRHSIVQIDENVAPDTAKDDELASLDWTKRSTDTNFLVPEQDREIPVNSQCSTPDIFDGPFQPAENSIAKPSVFEQELELELDQTQVFTRRGSQNSTILRSNNSQCSTPRNPDASLPPTQVFNAPAAKSRIPPVLLLRPSPVTASSPPNGPLSTACSPPNGPLTTASSPRRVPLTTASSPRRVPLTTANSPRKAPLPTMDEELPATQVFQRPASARSTTKDTGLSSTPRNSQKQTFENSFQTKCDKLLDSDNDEMDEIIAPELVKKMRESINQCKSPVVQSAIMTVNAALSALQPISSESSSTAVPTPAAVESASGLNLAEPESSQNTIAALVLSSNKFSVPETKTRKIKRLEPAVNIDKFLCTPDFIGKEFSKDKELQKLADENWKNQKKHLFDGEDTEHEITSDTEASQDSFKHLLPKKPSASRIPTHLPEVKKSEVLTDKHSRGRRSSALEKLNLDKKMLCRTTSSLDNPKKTKRTLRSRKRSIKTDGSESADTKITPPKAAKHTPEKNIPPVPPIQIGREKLKLRRFTHSESTDAKTSSQKDSEAPLKRKTRHVGKDLSDKPSSEKKTKRPTKEDNKPDGDADGVAAHERPGAKQRARVRKISDTTSGDTKDTRPPAKVPRKAHVDPHERDRKAEGDKAKKADNTHEKIIKIEKEKEDSRPMPRMTRLRSGLDASHKHEKLTAAQSKAKSMSVEIERLKNKEQKQKSRTPVVDLTDSDKEDAVKRKPARKSIARDSESSISVKRKDDHEVKIDSNEVRRLRPHEPKVKIAMTMCDPRYQEVLDKHSGVLWTFCKDPKHCDVLVVEKGNRTYKLLIAMARGIPVVNLDWLIEVLRRRSVSVPYEEYIFQDPSFQERHQFVMRKSLYLAKTSQLFKDIGFMMTPGIRPVPEEMRDIVVCAGGTVYDQPPKPHLSQRLYLISQVKDNQYWHRYRRVNINIKIVTTEGIMASVMQQSEAPLYKSIIQ